MSRLETYRGKRDFGRTGEPETGGEGSGFFVVQKHDASSLHYDFRIAFDGVLKSWAVTKRPSADPSKKRLAIRTEDHPLSYADFEGVIPRDQYGGGTVMLWDRGDVRIEGSGRKGLRDGKLKLVLGGERMKGGYALVRLEGSDKDDGRGQEKWLLVKEKDAHANGRISGKDKSVASGRTMAEIAEDEAVSGGGEAKVAGIAITHPDRDLFDGAGITKRGLAGYFERAADHMLPYLKGRLVSLVRCPEGIGDDCFFQKHAGAGLPDAFRTAKIKEKSGARKDYLLVETKRALVACAQVGVIELHLWASRTDKLERPDRMVFDLDPAPDVSFAEVRRAAFDVRAMMKDAGLDAFALVTGGKGIHVVLPFERRQGWDAFSGFAKALAEKLEADEPDRFVASASKEKREGKIFVDYLRNQRGSTAIAPFCPRAREGAPVAVPVTWDQLEGVKAANAFTLKDTDAVFAQAGAWRGYGKARNRLSKKDAESLGLDAGANF